MASRNENAPGTANTIQRQTCMTTTARSPGNQNSVNQDPRNIVVPLPSSYLHSMSANGPRYAAPPLPPRRAGTYPNNYNRMAAMGGGFYSPYSRFNTFGYSSPYSGYRMGSYGQYGIPNDGNNSFIQMAEESTRPAFESIESVVEVVGSISMMLESTYHAVHSSYSAILGVVDQFSRLKDHLAQILSVLALLRGLRWLCLKVLYLLGLRKDNPSVEVAWNNAERLAAGSNVPQIPGKAPVSAWPFLMFVSLVIGAPWLMFKLLSKAVPKKAFDRSMFVDENNKAYLATAAYDFTATQRNELSFRAGDKLCISKKTTENKGWIFACNEKKETGYIPHNYLVVRNRPFGTSGDSSPNSYSITVESANFPLQDSASSPAKAPVQVSSPPKDLKNAPSTSQIPVDPMAGAVADDAAKDN